MADIFKYLDYRKYLKDLYLEKKQSTTHFSFRYFARAAGFKSTNYLKLIMDGARNLSQEEIRKFSKGLKLKKDEALYFENLVHMNQSKTDEEKNFYYTRLSGSKKYLNARELEREQYEYYSKWYYVAIRELVSFSDFNEDPKWIAAKLGNKLSAKEIEQTIALLIKLNILKRNKKGKLCQVDSCLTTGPEVGSLAVANFHREMLNKAAQSIEETPSEYRDISCLTIPVSEKGLVEAKKMIQKFWDELHAFLADQKDYDAVYQFNFQLFNLSEVTWKKSKK